MKEVLSVSIGLLPRRAAKYVALGSVFAAVAATSWADNPSATINVDASANRRAISPLIYGANWCDQATLNDLNLAVNRRGGNATTTYNWQQNAANRAGDWYFESLGDGEGDPSLPSLGADAFTTATKAAGAETMMTIPMVDWVAKLGPNRSRLAAYSVAKYGAQEKTDPWWSDAGNGIRASDGSRIVSDPNDAYTTNSPAFQKLWVEHLVNKFGDSTSGGIKFYLTDNEHGCWPANHRPIVPVGPTMDSIRDRIIAYAGVVKEVDPDAQIVGPEEWGWPNYFNSPYDTQFSGGTDRAAHGGWDFMPWLLKELKAHEDSTGQRLLDIFSLHYYPQYNEFYTAEGDSSTAAQLKRNECTRDLWDPNYYSTSWIANRVKLIPRMKEWINANYPGTKIAITEYSWGAESHISGAIAQADVLGIFGREGVELATFWGSLTSGYPVRNAFKMYRNYDGGKSTFGDTSVSATVANPDQVAAFAAQRDSDGALTVMVICKHLTANTPVTVNLASFTVGGAAQVWQLTSANTINHLADATVTSGAVSFSAPPQSITLFVIPGAAVPAAPATPTGLEAASGDGLVDLSWNAVSGADSYIVRRSTSSGGGYADIASVALPVYADTGVANGTTYYYVVAATNTYGVSSNSVEASATPRLVTTLYQINSGGSATGDFAADAYFTGGSVYTVGTSIDTSGVVDPAPMGVYQSERWGNHGYTFTGLTAGADYMVRLHFAEIYYNNTGNRMFDVSINGSLVLDNFDIVAVAGAARKAVVREFTVQANGSGQIAVQYASVVDNAKSSGIEILAIVTPPPAAPTGLAAAAGDGRVDLSWSASATATGYRVKRSTTSGSGYAMIASTNSLALANTGLANGTLYYYVVSATNAGGESADSAEVGARPTSSDPVPLSVVLTNNQLQLNWPADHTGWVLEYNADLTDTNNWIPVPDSDATNVLDMGTITNESLFYRLVYP